MFLGALLNISVSNVSIPFTEWIMNRIIIGNAWFKYYDESFKLSNYMVQ